MPVIRNSKTSRLSKRSVAGAFLLLLAIGGVAAYFCYVHGWILYNNDAEAHLNIARRIVDSRTPGYEQIGTGWLPLTHVLMLPFVGNMTLWQTGLAGTIPGVICFALAGTALFAAIRRLFQSEAAALAGALIFALNPNLLYMQATPMTEPVLLAGVLGLLYFSVLFGQTQSLAAAAGAGLCSAAASMTRYDGWFLIPFAGLYILLAGGRKRWKSAALFGAIAGAVPVYWFAHNSYYFSDPLDFYRGPWSTKAVYQRGLDAGAPHFAGEGHLGNAMLYYGSAAVLCAGITTTAVGGLGVLIALWKRVWWAICLLALLPAFYVSSMYSSGAEIFVPPLYPYSYYNTRYGIGLLPLFALGAAALVAAVPVQFRKHAAAVVVAASVVPWLANPRPDNWVTWKEAEINSTGRRAWTREASTYLKKHYKPGSGLLISFGDLMGVLREAGIPLRESLHQGNGVAAMGGFGRPQLFLWEQWCLAISDDIGSAAILQVNKTGPYYQQVQNIRVKHAPVVEIYRRTHGHPIHESTRRAQ